MKKIVIRATALILAAILVLSLVPAAMAAENINFGIDVIPGADEILVTVAEGNDKAFAMLANENKFFALTVACDFSSAYVTFGENTVESKLDTAAKTIRFSVARSGKYRILPGEAPDDGQNRVFEILDTRCNCVETFTYEAGMTWAEWLNSEYNTGMGSAVAIWVSEEHAVLGSNPNMDIFVNGDRADYSAVIQEQDDIQLVRYY